MSKTAGAIEIERLTYAYPHAVQPALHEVTLRIGPGELCVLAGLSGSGKSTLLRAICGLVPHFYGGRFAGRATVCGMDTRSHPPARLGAAVGALFQDPEGQLVMRSVRSELALAAESRERSATGAARAVEEVALALGIAHLLKRCTRELSGGEQQRVALGAALVGRPSVVVLDEPTSQLDPAAGAELIALLRRLGEEQELTVVLCEQRLERCLGAADRVVALHEGRLVKDGRPEGFLRWAQRHAPPLQTPGARLFALAGLHQTPAGVRQARAALRASDLLGAPKSAEERSSEERDRHDGQPAKRGRWHSGPAAADPHPALQLRGIWLEWPNAPAALRGVDLSVAHGECVALLGCNGAGKSTLLGVAAGLLKPTRGRVRLAGRVALLLQSPGDYFLRERVGQELSRQALGLAGLEHLAGRDPRDLSGGERQRLALAIVAGDEPKPAALLALDEPTRGMDREGKVALASELRRRCALGQAVMLVTHDPELAAACAQRAVLLAAGQVVADGPASELLCGGWYFATETSRILDGAENALLPEQGAQLLRQRAVLRQGGLTQSSPTQSGLSQGGSR